MAELFQAVPELVVGKYLLNTTFDSGPLTLSEEEISCGWKSNGRYALSPPIKELDQIPDVHYTEWYSYTSPVELGECKIFVNHGGFSLEDDQYETLANEFWRQLSVMQAESYISEGVNLICVTKRTDLFNRLRVWKKE